MLKINTEKQNVSAGRVCCDCVECRHLFSSQAVDHVDFAKQTNMQEIVYTYNMPHKSRLLVRKIWVGGKAAYECSKHTHFHHAFT